MLVDLRVVDVRLVDVGWWNVRLVDVRWWLWVVDVRVVIEVVNVVW